MSLITEQFLEDIFEAQVYWVETNHHLRLTESKERYEFIIQTNKNVLPNEIFSIGLASYRNSRKFYL